MKLYIDTNVYLDYFLDRRNSKYAEKIFFQTVRCKHQIILSNHLVSELSRNIEWNKVILLFQMLKHKLIDVKLEEEDKEFAKTMPTHYADALHIVLAKKAEADAIITNNLKDFESIFKTYSPESFR